MFDRAQDIFNYLPIEQGSESRYIKQLWDSFFVLSTAEDDVPYFSIMPFHLLFMLAIQYKAYRLSAWNKDYYLNWVNTNKYLIYNNECKQQLLSNVPLNKELLWNINQSSVKTLSLIKEKHIFGLFSLIGIGDDIIVKAKALVENRNDRFHANGEIDEKAEEKIDDYLEVLEYIQEKFKEVGVNQDIQGDWSQDIEEGVYPLDEFFEEKFLYSQFSQKDFSDIIKPLIISDNLDFDQWKFVIDKCLELAPEDTIRCLEEQVMIEVDEDKRFNIEKIIKENQ